MSQPAESRKFGDLTLGVCTHFASFASFIERILPIGDENIVVAVVPQGLHFREKTASDRPLKGQQWVPIRDKIVTFLGQNERWFAELDRAKGFLPLSGLQVFKHDPTALSQVYDRAMHKKKIRDAAPKGPSLTPRSRSLRNNNRTPMDAWFKSSDGQRIGAHKIFLPDIPHFQEAIAKLASAECNLTPLDLEEDLFWVADAETIDLFLDIEYGEVNPDKFKDDSFLKLFHLSQHYKYERTLFVAIEVLMGKLQLAPSPLSTLNTLPFILQIPPALFTFTLFEKIPLRDPEISPQILETFLKFEEENKENAVCLFLIGFFYRKDIGVGKNPDLAFKYFNRSHHLRLPIASFYVGKCLNDGEGTLKNRAEAFRIFTISANGGEAEAWISLGHLYENPQGIPGIEKDDHKAIECFQKSLELGSTHAGGILERRAAKKGSKPTGNQRV